MGYIEEAHPCSALHIFLHAEVQRIQLYMEESPLSQVFSCLLNIPQKYRDASRGPLSHLVTIGVVCRSFWFAKASSEEREHQHNARERTVLSPVPLGRTGKGCGLTEMFLG